MSNPNEEALVEAIYVLNETLKSVKGQNDRLLDAICDLTATLKKK